MSTTYNSNGKVTEKDETGEQVRIRRFDTPNRLVAIARYVFNNFKESFLHPTVTSTLDMRTGKVVARDGKRLDK